MRKFKYIGADKYIKLEIGGVYDVIQYIHDGNSGDFDEIDLVLNDMVYRTYVKDLYNIPKFKDVTSEHRNEVIDDILN